MMDLIMVVEKTRYTSSHWVSPVIQLLPLHTFHISAHCHGNDHMPVSTDRVFDAGV